MTMYPWNNSTNTIAAQLAGQFETPTGAQAKADAAKIDAETFSTAALATHTDIANSSAHTGSNIAQDSTHRFVSDAQITAWNNKASGDLATTTTNGQMAATDKVKLNGIATGAQVNQNAFSTIGGVAATTASDTLAINGGIGIDVAVSGKNLTITATGTATPGAHASTHITGGTDVIPNAVANGNSGLMSGADKALLDGIPNDYNTKITNVSTRVTTLENKFNAVSVVAPSAYLNSWAKNGSDPVGYSIDSLGRVQLHGKISGGVVGQTAFVLPDNVKPTYDKMFVIVNNGAVGYLGVFSTGGVRLTSGSNTLVDLTSVSFIAGT